MGIGPNEGELTIDYLKRNKWKFVRKVRTKQGFVASLMRDPQGGDPVTMTAAKIKQQRRDGVDNSMRGYS